MLVLQVLRDSVLLHMTIIGIPWGKYFVFLLITSITKPGTFYVTKGYKHSLVIDRKLIQNVST